MPNNVCCVDGCEEIGAFRTTSRPTWCVKHIEAIYRLSGVELAQEFTKPADYMLTRCLSCGFEAHYKFNYVAEKHTEGVCRACYWRRWAASARSSNSEHLLRYLADPSLSESWDEIRALIDDVPEEDDLEEIKAKADASGYDYLGPLTTPSLTGDPHGLKCRKCGKISAERSVDVGWKCTCWSNPKSAGAGSRSNTEANLLKNSDNPAKEWWDFESNTDADWNTAKLKSNKVVFWQCPIGHNFQARIRYVTDGIGYSTCPECRDEADRQRAIEKNKLLGLTVSDVPALLKLWADETPPSEVLLTDHNDQGWLLNCGRGHKIRAYFLETYAKNPEYCPTCRGDKTRADNATKARRSPNSSRLTPEISSQWHPSKNGTRTLASVFPESRVTYWWKDPVCGHEFQATARERDRYTRYRSPTCSTILDSLAYHYPDIASEWAEENPITPWHIRANTTKLAFIPTWVCDNNPNHRYQMMPTLRLRGAGCPMCRETGKSRIELQYADYFRNQWDGVALESGNRARSDLFDSGASWEIDILIKHENLPPLAIEYDGEYWHRDKLELDTTKTQDLINAGYLVCRIREDGLPALPFADDPRYLEITTYPEATSFSDDFGKIQRWYYSTAQNPV